MTMCRRFAYIAALMLAVLSTTTSGAEPGSEIAAEKVRLDKVKRTVEYFRFGPKVQRPPKGGYGLLVILPGGNGSADFHPFCKRIIRHACPDDFVGVQLVAVKWTPAQTIVWPTKKMRVPKMEMSTEDYIARAVLAARKWKKINPRRIYLLAWSSSGPAVYATMFQKKVHVAGAFVAMSVFQPPRLPPLRYVKGRRFYLFHSPGDQVCQFAGAELALKRLTQAGAKVELQKYAGGHGWRGSVFSSISDGIKWLEGPAGR